MPRGRVPDILGTVTARLFTYYRCGLNDGEVLLTTTETTETTGIALAISLDVIGTGE